MYCVIGSGPAGVASASALVAAGRKVLLLDVGLTLESEHENRRLRMASHDPDEWTREDVVASRAALTVNGDLEAKLCHGSDYPYRSVSHGIRVDYGDLAVRSSFAQGGLSNIWGAALLPFRAADTHDWPISAAELQDAHAAVLRMMPVAGVRDDLVQLFPLPVERIHEPKSSQQIMRFLEDLARNRDRLARHGIVFGSARLAVGFKGNSAAESCNYCGHCMNGCPRDLIYSSRHTLNELIGSGKLIYIANAAVYNIIESEQRVTVQASVGGDLKQFQGERVFLAAGVFNSTAILLRSLGWYGQPVTIKDSQYYIFPLLRMAPSANVASERLHTLAQVFMEISNTTLSPHIVHLQIYGFNDLLADILAHRLRRFWQYLPQNALLGRLLVVQGFLHSDHSGSIKATLKRSHDGDALELEGIPNPDAPARISRVIRQLRHLSPALRAFPVSMGLQIAQPGRSFHCGGSFPMAKSPGAGQTDCLGRPFGWNRMHVVDATVFPSIAATTITQTVMANAFRIATQSAHLDPREQH